MQQAVAYPGRDLEAMSFAEKYHRWILQVFEPYLGSRLVEVGAGSGSFSELLLEARPASLTLVEPSREMYPLLVARLSGAPGVGAEVVTYNSLFRDAAGEIGRRQRPDSIIYVNVLEHVPDDEAELAAVGRTLPRGGRVLIFVPALRWLYGSFDELVGHQRRYTRRELEAKCERAGFRVLLSGYLDLPGVLPWWVKYCLLRSPKMEAGAVKFYDRYCVPAIRAVETRLRPPVGKNIFLAAEKV